MDKSKVSTSLDTVPKHQKSIPQSNYRWISSRPVLSTSFTQFSIEECDYLAASESLLLCFRPKNRQEAPLLSIQKLREYFRDLSRKYLLKKDSILFADQFKLVLTSNRDTHHVVYLDEYVIKKILAFYGCVIRNSMDVICIDVIYSPDFCAVIACDNHPIFETDFPVLNPQLPYEDIFLRMPERMVFDNALMNPTCRLCGLNAIMSLLRHFIKHPLDDDSVTSLVESSLRKNTINLRTLISQNASDDEIDKFLVRLRLIMHMEKLLVEFSQCDGLASIRSDRIDIQCLNRFMCENHEELGLPPDFINTAAQPDLSETFNVFLSCAAVPAMIFRNCNYTKSISFSMTTVTTCTNCNLRRVQRPTVTNQLPVHLRSDQHNVLRFPESVSDFEPAPFVSTSPCQSCNHVNHQTQIFLTDLDSTEYLYVHIDRNISRGVQNNGNIVRGVQSSTLQICSSCINDIVFQPDPAIRIMVYPQTYIIGYHSVGTSVHTTDGTSGHYETLNFIDIDGQKIPVVHGDNTPALPVPFVDNTEVFGPFVDCIVYKVVKMPASVFRVRPVKKTPDEEEVQAEKPDETGSAISGSDQKAKPGPDMSMSKVAVESRPRADKIDPAKAGLAKAGPAKADAAKAGPAKAGPAKADPAKTGKKKK